MMQLSTLTALSLFTAAFAAAKAPPIAAGAPAAATAAAMPTKGGPTVADAKAFIEEVERRLEELGVKNNFAAWLQQTYIIYDSEKLAAETDREFSVAVAKFAGEAKRFDWLDLPEDIRRKLLKLRLGVVAPPPPDPKEQRELSEIGTWLSSEYGKGKYCPQADKCMTLPDMEDVLKDSRDPATLLDVWKGWRTVSPPMKPKYARMVELANKGAKDLGFKDTGALWRYGYDMPPKAFTAELDRLWGQLRPLYLSLHGYVRARLVEKYGEGVVGKDGTIPAHLLGNMWAQSWENVYDLVAPPSSESGFDLSKILQERKTDEKEMVRMGERFFTSLGFDALPATFWERSLFTKPKDREVVCHASAWDVENSYDLRIKMCIKINSDDFTTIHHELGHNFYQRAYAGQPYLFRGSANDGFHEALGDTIALSVTPDYLKRLGFIDKVPGPEGDTALLMRMALERLAFLPFGLMVDQWRWKVFSGEVGPDAYNKTWWDLARKYQGVRPPVERTEKDFDPGAKYHVPANVPYTRYFLAHVLEFQFYRSLCRDAGSKGPLHRCSFYGDKKAGEKLNRMMAMGASRPWPEALEAATGSRQMDATALLDYFAPLQRWLDEQNKGRKLGWD